MQKLPVVLYFVNDVTPSEEQQADAADMKAQVRFRHAGMVPAEGSLEECDYVAGEVPDRYAEAYPAYDGQTELDLEGGADDAGEAKGGRRRGKKAPAADTPPPAPETAPPGAPPAPPVEGNNPPPPPPGFG